MTVEELAILLYRVKKKAPDVYRHIMGLIKAILAL